MTEGYIKPSPEGNVETLPEWFDAMRLAQKHRAYVQQQGGFQKGRGKELFASLKEHDKSCSGC